jgi:hypothetical protein
VNASTQTPKEKGSNAAKGEDEKSRGKAVYKPSKSETDEAFADFENLSTQDQGKILLDRIWAKACE